MKTEREKKKDELINFYSIHFRTNSQSKYDKIRQLESEIAELEKEDDTNAIEAELRSLKQTIIESGLLSYAPEREMSFHNKVVFAIDKL
ncbi:MAG TPA: hypothetical protein VMV77_09125, partial [Bacteroidales bacterium]|nr:hypothetical protein [Bacteroidales bacterium]